MLSIHDFYNNVSITTVKASTIGPPNRTLGAAPLKGKTPVVAPVFAVELPAELVILEAPSDKDVIVDVGVIVRCDVSVCTAAAEADRLIDSSIADAAEAGGIVKRPCGVLVVVCIVLVEFAVTFALAVLLAFEMGLATVEAWLEA